LKQDNKKKYYNVYNVSDVWDIPDGSIIIRNSTEVIGYMTSESYFDWILFETIPAGSLILQGNVIAE